MISEDIPLEEGLMIMEEAIDKAKKIMQGYPETKFTSEEFQKYYDCVYSMSFDEPRFEKSRQLYIQLKRSLEESIETVVVPSLMCQEDDAYLLRQLVLQWSNYKLMAKRLCQFYQYLDRYFVPLGVGGLSSLNELTVRCYQDLVLKKFYCQFQAAALSLINLERKGLYIDRDLLRNVVHAFVEFRTDGRTKYYQDFEKAMLADASAYYSQLASDWFSNDSVYKDFERAMLADSSAYYCQSASDLFLCDSMPDYVQKVYLFIMEERRRVSHYFHLGAIELLLQIVRNQLLDLPANKFFEKMEAENNGITTDYQEMLPKCASMTLEGGSSVSAEEIPFALYRVDSF